MKLKNKVAIVTGASRGIGKAIALTLAKEGAKVVINYLNSKELADTVVKEITNNGGESFSVQADVTKDSDVARLVNETIDKYGRIDILINNAGNIFRPGNWDCDSETWDLTLNTNLKGPWNLIKQCVKNLKEQEGSSIVNISSYVGELGSQYVLPYGIAKAGIVNMTKAFAKELAPTIRVNSVSPGNIDTEMTQGAGAEFIQKTIENTPLKRLGQPDEIAKAVLFLVSEESSFITGVNLDVDGGYLLLN